ncbi:MAG: PDZ domain-containing protein [Polyangiaceae bacterium]
MLRLLTLPLLALLGCAPPHGTIGALLVQKDDGRLLVHDVPAGLAAERAGVHAGDEVLLIDGRDVRGLSASAVHQALGGEVGEPVKLTLVRADQIVRVTLLRSAARAPQPKTGAKPAGLD